MTKTRTRKREVTIYRVTFTKDGKPTTEWVSCEGEYETIRRYLSRKHKCAGWQCIPVEVPTTKHPLICFLNKIEMGIDITTEP